MNFKKSLPMMALVFGVCAAFATKQAVTTVHPSKHFDDQVYFEFTGTHGNEATVNNWQEISASAYSDLECAGSTAGCGISQNSSTVTGSAPNRVPSNVPVNGSSTPQVDGTYTTDAMDKP